MLVTSVQTIVQNVHCPPAAFMHTCCLLQNYSIAALTGPLSKSAHDGSTNSLANDCLMY